MSDESFHTACDLSFISYSSDDSVCTLNTLYQNLQHTFLDYHKFLNLCHINCQSIPAHHNELLDAFSSLNLHAILISESWLKPQLDSSWFAIPGYILIRNDRLGKRGGGVALYLRSDLKYTILANSPSLYTASAEFMFLQVQVGGAKVILGVVYCPPNTDFYLDLERALETISFQSTHQIIMGDFNTDLLKDSPSSQKLRNIFQSVNLSVLPLDATHHNIDSPDTWLDLILVSSPEHVLKHGNILAPGFSRHDLIFTSYKLKQCKPKPSVIQMRNFTKIDVDCLRLDAQNLDFSPVFNSDSIDDKVFLYNSAIIGLFDKHAPINSVRLRRPPAPWITDKVRKAMACRDHAFRKFKKNRSEANWDTYKAMRNRCNSLVRAAKRQYIYKNIACSSSADIWKFLNNFGVGKPQAKTDLTCFPLNVINEHFVASPVLPSSVTNVTVSELIRNFVPSHSVRFSFSPVTVDDVIKTINAIKSNADGCDGLSRSMIIPIVDIISDVLTHIINYSLSEGVFPSSWRNAYVIPIPKVSKPSLISHFRPISILPFLSKVLEAIVHKQLFTFCHKFNILSPLQSGFRPGHSTSTALLKVTEDIRKAMENKQLTLLVLIDFSNAFNTVTHEIMLTMLKCIGFSSKVLDWFLSYLCGRQQAVRVDRVCSDWLQLPIGVPQGGILSPLLFSIFINFITFILHCHYHIYADDLQLYVHSDIDNISNAISEINVQLEAIKTWSNKFGIKVNPTKCQAIILGSQFLVRRIDFSVLPPVVFDGSVISLTTSVKDLGIYIDCSLNWANHITELSQRVTFTLRSLNRLRHFLPIKTKILLVNSLIHPIIDYADICYPDLSAHLVSKIDRLQNNAIRFIFSLRKFDHITEYRTRLQWLSISRRRQYRILCFLFTILFDKFAPVYLKDNFKFLADSHNLSLRSCDSLLLSIPLHRTGFMSNSFTLKAARYWNNLPKELRSITSKEAFKGQLKKYLLKGDMC